MTKIADQTLPVNDPKQSYVCESPAYLDDPYEGELFTYFIEFFSGLSKAEKEKLWAAKRAKLVSVEYNVGGVGPITVEQGMLPRRLCALREANHEKDIGFRLMSHGRSWSFRTSTLTLSGESSLNLFLSSLLTLALSRLHHNAERVRTCNSVVTKVPGLFASVNNSTDPSTDEIIGYISPAGIVSVASQQEQEHDVITPYGAWPTIMFDKSVGLAWWWNMVQGTKMQSESIKTPKPKKLK